MEELTPAMDIFCTCAESQIITQKLIIFNKVVSIIRKKWNDNEKFVDVNNFTLNSISYYKKDDDYLLRAAPFDYQYYTIITFKNNDLYLKLLHNDGYVTKIITLSNLGKLDSLINYKLNDPTLIMNDLINKCELPIT